MVARRALLASLAGAAAAGRPAGAQAPKGQPLRLIVPFAPGGPADAMARLLGRPMGASLGQPVVVENRSGAGGVLGVETAARARPDGQTVVLASTGALAVLPHMMPRMPYDPMRDLSPVALVLDVPQVLVVSPQSPARTVAELVAAAKGKPGRLTYGSAGTGSSLHMAGELFKLRAGVDITHAPYRGAAPALTDLMSGTVDLVLGDASAVVEQVRGGSLRALAVTAATRSRALLDVPTMAEAGLPGVESETWYAVFAPAGTPPDRIAALNAAVAAALADSDARRALEDLGGNLVGGPPEALAARLRAEHAKWGEVVRAAGVRMD